jgi:hypothetical protein
VTTTVLRRLAVPLVAGLALAAVPAGASEPPADQLPPGWVVEGNELVWTSEAPLRIGGARYEFRSGARLLGYPVQDGDTLRLPLTMGGPVTELSVWAAGRRLDGAGAARRGPSVTPPAEEAVALAATDPATPGRFRTQRDQRAGHHRGQGDPSGHPLGAADRLHRS